MQVVHTFLFFFLLFSSILLGTSQSQAKEVFSFAETARTWRIGTVTVWPTVEATPPISKTDNATVPVEQESIQGPLLGTFPQPRSSSNGTLHNSTTAQILAPTLTAPGNATAPASPKGAAE